MTRRELLENVAILLGGSIVGASVFSATGCASSAKQVNELFNTSQLALMDDIADTIIPATNTPGAKAAQVGRFMATMVLDCYSKQEQQVFIEGLAKVDALSEKQFGKSFINANVTQRTELLTTLDKEQKQYQSQIKKDEPAHYFRMMKELTVLGYFSSKEGTTQALRYAAVPGKFAGDVAYKKGDKAWAT